MESLELLRSQLGDVRLDSPFRRHGVQSQPSGIYTRPDLPLRNVQEWLEDVAWRICRAKVAGLVLAFF